MQKPRFDRQTIVAQGLDLVRQGGETALGARTLATALGCSTQPLFSNFRNMEELKEAVVAAAWEEYTRFLAEETASGKYPPYKAAGMGYIRFAAEEKNLFRLLFMRDRTKEAETEDSTLEPLYELIMAQCGIDRGTAQLVHLEMWAVVHGIATMTVTGFYTVDFSLMSRMLTDVFEGLIWRFSQKEE